MSLGALVYLYRRRLRVHGVQELLAGLGVASSVALVFATLVASASVAGSSARLVRTVVGSATLQLRARDPDGFSGTLLRRVEALAGVEEAAPLLEQTATLDARDGRRLTVDLAGADTALTVLDGLAHTLPRETLAAGAVGLSRASAQALEIPTSASTQAPMPTSPHTPGTPMPTSAHTPGTPPPTSPRTPGTPMPTSARTPGTPMPTSAHTPVGDLADSVTVLLRGAAPRLRISEVLGTDTIGPLAGADVAVMPLGELQRLAGLGGRVTRILVQAQPGREAAVRRELDALAGGRVEVAAADQDVSLLEQALRPSNQASALFAAISVLLGVLFAASALLLTVPERRRAIADLRLIGTRRGAIVQMLLFQALCLGLAASLVGLASGYALSRGVLHQSSDYLGEAFTLGTSTLVTARPLLLALGAGVLATCVASAVPLLDLRRGRALDAVYHEDGAAAAAVRPVHAQRALAFAGALPLAGATVLFASAPARALVACELLALATVLMVPLTFATVLRGAQAVSERHQRLTVLPVALSSLRSTKLRSLALAGTGALALFGAIALGGARADLLRGVQRFAHSYAAEASIWVGTPGDNQAVVDFRADGLAQRLTHIDGVAGVSAFQGGFVQLDGRRVWVLARPPSAVRGLLAGQIVDGSPAALTHGPVEGGWVAVSQQIAQARHVGVGGTLALPTPRGEVSMRIAATTTNLAWSPGAILMSSADYTRLWATRTPTALAVTLTPGASTARVLARVRRAIGSAGGLQAITAREREASIDALISEGLSRLGEISALLLFAATLALAAALTSAIWQRRVSLATLRLSGVRPRRVRLILLVESALMLGAGCLTGVLAGVYGQVVIDSYLRHVTGFPVASLDASSRPLEILALVSVVVLALVAVPVWLASRVSPILALNE
jgi:putative ABC transport system permease protein